MLQVTDPNSANTWSGERKYIFTQSFVLCVAFLTFAVTILWRGDRRVTCQPLPFQQVVLCLGGASVGLCCCLSVVSCGHELVPHLSQCPGELRPLQWSWCVWHLPSAFLLSWLTWKCCSSFVPPPTLPFSFQFWTSVSFLFCFSLFL